MNSLFWMVLFLICCIRKFRFIPINWFVWTVLWEIWFILASRFVLTVLSCTFRKWTDSFDPLCRAESLIHFSKSVCPKWSYLHLHLSDAFIQSDLQCIQAIHVLSVCLFPGNWTHNLYAANAMLYHWATGTLFHVAMESQIHFSK